MEVLSEGPDRKRWTGPVQTWEISVLDAEGVET